MNCFRCLYHESHRCRNEKTCPDGMAYVEYTGSIVRQCLLATTEIFQDGYVHCPILESIGCVECEKRFGDGSGWERDESQNYERKPKWREDEEEVPKRTYYTKCGRKFEKNSTAVVTGYTIDENDKECADCPFWVEVTDGWGENKRHIRWECRAGSKPPNQVNDWVGSTEDKLTIQIRSLHKDFLESIFEYCESQPDLSAGYNQDLDDCRRVISISCSQNKKGVAAKKALIEKFFPATEAVPDERYEDENEDEESLFDERKCRVCGCTESNGCPGGCYWVEEDLCSRCAEIYKNVPEICKHCENEGTGCMLNNTEAGMCAAFAKKGENEEMNCIGCTYWPPKGSTKCNRIGVDREVTENSVRCGWYHNVKTGEMGPLMYEESYGEPMPAESEINIDNAQPPKETSVEDTALEVPVSNNVQPFDYSTVDDKTAAFLQEKANRITEIRIKSVIALGKELKEAHDRLANNKTGTFEAWVKSLGITHQTSRNYINAYNYILKNFEHIEEAENIQPSLLFAASKPSAPKELSDKVASGDITTHKQYNELEQRLKAAEERAERAINQKFVAENKAIEAEQKCRKAEKDRDDSIRAFERDINNLRQQLEQAKRNGDSSKVQELGKRIADYQAEVESLEEDKKTLNQEINNLRKQLKERPIEVPATRTVEKEVIPDEVALAIYDKVARLYEGLERLTEKEIQIFAAQVDQDYADDIINNLRNAAHALDAIETAIIACRQEPEMTDEDTHIQEPEGHCGDCAHADMDGVTDEQLDDCKTLCTLTGEIVDFDHTCGKYKRYGG